MQLLNLLSRLARLCGNRQNSPASDTKMAPFFVRRNGNVSEQFDQGAGVVGQKLLPREEIGRDFNIDDFVKVQQRMMSD